MSEVLTPKNWDETKIHKDDWMALRENAGLMMDEASASSVIAYRRARGGLPTISAYRDKINFACLCMRCMWDKTAKKVPLPVMIRQMTNTRLQDTLRKKMEYVLDGSWRDDGYMLKYLYSIVSSFRQNKQVMPDFEALADDIYHWDNVNVKNYWINNIY